MSINAFKEHLQKLNFDNKKIEQALEVIDEFNNFLLKQQKTINNASYEDAHNFSSFLITNKRNTLDNYIFLLRFGQFMKNNQLIVASMEMFDGGEVMENFSKRLIDEFGEKKRNEIFDIEIPPLGLHPTKKPGIAKHLINRFLDNVDHAKCKEFLADGLREKYTEHYKSEREKFLKMKDIDAFLNFKHQNLVKTLEKHLEERTLWYIQEIDENVIEYVKNNAMTEAGVRNGNRIYITKIPYMTKQYLKETDENMKRYYYCHCPWIREGLKLESQPISPIFCNCSAGYYKNYWEGVLGQPVKVELLESVLNGDNMCKFVLNLPEEFLNSIEKK